MGPYLAKKIQQRKNHMHIKVRGHQGHNVKVRLGCHVICFALQLDKSKVSSFGLFVSDEMYGVGKLRRFRCNTKKSVKINSE